VNEDERQFRQRDAEQTAREPERDDLREVSGGQLSPGRADAL
jgi:hypothetical protein